MSTDRSIGLDVGRAIAVLTVVFGHAQTGIVGTTAYDIGARFAVPFFFLVSGFFLRRPDAPLAMSLVRLAQRLLLPFALWLAIYLAWFEPPASAFLDPIFLVKLIVQGGPAHHLWFLPSLAVSLALFLVLLDRGAGPRTVLAVATGLYVLALVFGAYHDALTGSGRFVWNMRNGPFFAFPFLAAGWWIARAPQRPGLAASVALMAAGAALHTAEILTMDRYGLRFEHDQLLGTLPFGVGFFLVMLNLPASRPARWLARLGPYSLGIYCMHLLFIEISLSWEARGILPPLDAGFSPYLRGLLVAIACVATCALAASVPWLRPFVRHGGRQAPYTARPAQAAPA
ncbi:acyltransferase [Aureimonas sp. AU12]|uniref:acyltransferase n=1 Tax=Aureimonas sp. AU12 TaxID=1638161 RepID=UPI000784CD36|nr:acyltransferase [Aureimonas sp. AU12]